MSPSQETLDIARRLREVREEVGLTLREVCQKAEIAPSYLSNLEQGKSSPTLATLRKILRGLNTDLEDFFARSGNGEVENFVFRRENMRIAVDGGRRYTFLFPRRKDIKMEILEEYYMPGKVEVEFETLDCDVAVVLLSGVVEFEVDGEKKEIVRSGDSFYIPSGRRHRARCISSEPAHLITAFTPPIY